MCLGDRVCLNGRKYLTLEQDLLLTGVGKCTSERPCVREKETKKTADKKKA